MELYADGKMIDLGIVRGADLSALYSALIDAGMERVATWRRLGIPGYQESFDITERLFVMPGGEYYIFFHSGGSDTKYAVVEQCSDTERRSSLVWSNGHLIAIANSYDVYCWITERFTPDEAREAFAKNGRLDVLRQIFSEIAPELAADLG